MLIDLKYHLVSLVAVFLALAVGILIGSSLITGASVERKLAKNLEREFAKLRMENQKQHTEIQNLQMIVEKHNKFENHMVPMLTTGRLNRYRIAIIRTGDYNAPLENIKSTLEGAGANVAYVISLNDIFAEKSNESLEQIITEISGETSVPNPKDRILQMISNCILTGSNPHALDVMAAKGLISMSGEYGGRAFRVILVGGSKSKDANNADEIDVPLIEKLKSSGAFAIVGSEPVNAVTSYIPAYQSQNISTIDNVDEPMGLICMVFALLGDSGNFGVKKTADRTAPSYLEKELWRNRYR